MRPFPVRRLLKRRHLDDPSPSSPNATVLYSTSHARPRLPGKHTIDSVAVNFGLANRFATFQVGTRFVIMFLLFFSISPSGVAHAERGEVMVHVNPREESSVITPNHVSFIIVDNVSFRLMRDIFGLSDCQISLIPSIRSEGSRYRA